jgi:hypothetical protein
MFVLKSPTETAALPTSADRRSPIPRRDRSPAARLAALQKRAERERRVVGLLNSGMGLARSRANPSAHISPSARRDLGDGER